MIAATSAETSDALSRRSFTSASNAAAKPGSEASSRRIALPYGLTEPLDQRRHFGRAQLERGAVDDQPRRHLADHRLFGERIFDQRPPGRDKIDDEIGRASCRERVCQYV